MGSSKVYDTLDATGIAEAIAAGELSADHALETALVRVIDRNPALNAVVNIQAETARAAIAAGLPQGPLTGVPFLLKDLGTEAVGLPGDNGSNLLRGTNYAYDSAIVARLRAAGAVLFGRTTCPEGGIGIATEAKVYGGPTRNPWNLEHTPGGSSGGSAAAVAAGIVPAAHGSDGGGSVRIPASCCGLFGFKPTRARLPDGPSSGEGWAGMAIDGFLTRSVRDTAMLLDICSGPDLGAPYMAPPLQRGFVASLDHKSRPLRVGLCTTNFDGEKVHPECIRAAEKAGLLLESLGHVVEPARPKVDMRPMMEAWNLIIACGTALWVRQKLAALGRDLRDDDLEPVAHSAVEWAKTVSGDAYLEAVDTIHEFGRQMARFFEDYDLLVSPTLAEPPAKIGRFAHNWKSYLDYRLGPNGVFAYSPFAAAFNASGQPAASVPLHWSEAGLPIGVHLASPFGTDEALMALCADLERAAPWFHKRPKLALAAEMEGTHP